jgi:hypothetical protein
MSVQGRPCLNRRMNKMSHLILIDTDGKLGGKTTVDTITDEIGNKWVVDWPKSAAEYIKAVNAKGTRLALRIHRDTDKINSTRGDTVTGTLTVTLADGSSTPPQVDAVPVDYLDDDAPC